MIDTLAGEPENPESPETVIPGSAAGARVRAALLAALRPVGVVGVALLIGMGLILYTGQNPLPAYESLLIEPFKSWDSVGAVLFDAIPLVLTGLAAAVAFRANVFNIGGEGQLQLGALATAWAVLALGNRPAVVVIPVAIVAGAVAGGLWAGIAGWLRAYLGATELVSTIMLNYVAIDLASYAVGQGGPLAATSGPGNATDTVPAAAQFPTFGASQFHWGFVVALLAVAILFAVLYRTPLGYEIRMVGANALFARYGGVRVARVIVGAMLISGALAGIGGAVQVMGSQHQYNIGFTQPQWGFTGVTVALLARLEPVGVVVAALLYALLQEGAQLMEDNTNVNHNIILVVQGLIILFVTVQVTLSWRRRRPHLPTHV